MFNTNYVRREGCYSFSILVNEYILPIKWVHCVLSLMVSSIEAQVCKWMQIYSAIDKK